MHFSVLLHTNRNREQPQADRATRTADTGLASQPSAPDTTRSRKHVTDRNVHTAAVGTAPTERRTHGSKHPGNLESNRAQPSRFPPCAREHPDKTKNVLPKSHGWPTGIAARVTPVSNGGLQPFSVNQRCGPHQSIERFVKLIS